MEVISAIEIDIPLPGAHAIGSIPSVTAINLTPSVIAPGENIGQRASVSVTFRDHPYPLAGTSFNSGTFWGKLRALRRSLQGLPLRVVRQVDGVSITEHYSVESLSRNSGDLVTVVAKDLLKIADGDRSQAPALSHGRLLEAIDDAVTTMTLTPAGIGALEYPASGELAIGGSEIVSFTRSGDVCSILRAQSGTEAKEHDADEIVQIVLIYESLSPAVIFHDLLTNYTEIDASWLLLSEWQEDIDTYIGRLYSAKIAEPTSVKTLLDELIEQAGMVTWWDAVEQKVRLKSLRPVTGARVISTDEMMADSFNFQEQPAKRVSEAWILFALRNPLAKLNDTTNYRSTYVGVDPNDTEYEQAAIRKVFSRWIAINNRPAASRLASLLLSRYRDPPRKFSFDLFATSECPDLGQGLELEHWSLQDQDGATITAPVQVTSIERDEDRYVIDAEEMLFTTVEDPELPAGVRLLIIDSDSYNINLRTLHDSFYTEPEEYDEVLCIIEADIKVGSTSTATPAFDVGDWPDNVDITLKVQGRIQGHGGISSLGGGVALYARYAVTVEHNGEIWGGGGGGGMGAIWDDFLVPTFYGGGGGAGYDPGSGMLGGGTGTTEAGGTPGGGGAAAAGAGGGPGEDGAVGGVSPGGDAGSAIDGISFVVITTDSGGSSLGPQIN